MIARPISASDVAVVLLALNLAHQCAWAVGVALPIWLYAPALLCLLPIAMRARWHGLSMTLLFLVPLLLILSSPTADWDARSIWMFHAKRIFLDGSLYAQLDGYAEFSHNDYPVLVPAIAASIASAVGYWNEVLPRLSVLFALLPVSILLAKAIGDRALFMAFAAAVCVVAGPLLWNGYMDAILALYFAAGCLLVEQLRTDPQNRKALLSLALILACLLMLKNEGLVAALLLASVGACWLRQRPLRALIALAAPFLFYLLIWRLPVARAGIEGDLITGKALSIAIDRLLAIDPLLAIIGGAYLQIGIALIAALAIPVSVERRWAMLPIALYLAALIAVYMITPHDLGWHLDSSVPRTLLPVTIALLAVLASALARSAHRRGIADAVQTQH